MRGRRGGLRFVAAVGDELGSLPGTVLGVGVVPAAAAAARLCAEARPDAVLFVGTCGAYPGGPKVGAVVAATEVVLGDAAAILGFGYVPRAPGPIPADAALLARLGLPGARVLTAVAISTDPGLARRYAELAEVEHMEAFGVAWACREAGVAFGAVLGVANEVGPDAHSQWLHHRIAMQRAAQEHAARLLA